MATVLNRTTKQLIRSVNTPDYNPVDWIINPDLSAVEGFPSIYWTITGDVVTLQNQSERDATDAAIAAALITDQKTEAEQLHDDVEALSRALRAVVLLTVGELNALRTQWRDFQIGVANSNNLSQLKTEVAALPSLEDRTYQQARTAIGNNIQGE